MNYSEIFSTSHNEIGSVGYQKNGTHYSVLRTTTWFDQNISPLMVPKIQDFAIIWDKRHKEEIIDVVEHMYMNNLLAPVLFVGESNCCLNIIVSPHFKKSSDEHEFFLYLSSIVKIIKNNYVPWTAKVFVFEDGFSEFQLPDWSLEDSTLYLKNISMLWDIGLKDFKFGLRRPDLSIKPAPSYNLP